MRPDLVVDYEILRASAASLESIADSLREAEARRDGTGDIWGSTRVATAMSEFVDNWNRYRTQLVESLDGVGRLCAATRDRFELTDREIGDALSRVRGEEAP